MNLKRMNGANRGFILLSVSLGLAAWSDMLGLVRGRRCSKPEQTLSKQMRGY